MNHYITSDDKLTLKIVAENPAEEQVLKDFNAGYLNLSFNVIGGGFKISFTDLKQPEQTKADNL